MADRDLTEDEVADLKEAFAMFDINGDGACRICTTQCIFSLFVVGYQTRPGDLILGVNINKGCLGAHNWCSGFFP